jgi:hydrogenase maturation protease
VEFIDGGTQGLALLGCISNRQALVVLDALSTGAPAGTLSVLRAPQVAALGAPRSTTAHEGNAGELLAAAALLGDLPGQVFVIGIEPQCLRTGCALSTPVRDALPLALAQAQALIEQILRE